MKANIDEFLNQKMDRKEFLKNVGAGVAAVVGMGMIVRAFQSQVQPKQASTSGYGSSAYGGSPKPTPSQPRKS